jgi:hypothetical protein
MNTRTYLNLSNGLFAVANPHVQVSSFAGVIRLQSTWCEQKRWAEILDAFSDDILFHLAIGNRCVVIDYGANKEVSRAIWQGLELIKFVISRVWVSEDYKPQGRAASAYSYFSEVYTNLPASTITRLKYFRKFVNVEDFNVDNLVGQSHRTDRDGDYDYLAKLAEKFNTKRRMRVCKRCNKLTDLVVCPACGASVLYRKDR